MSAKSKRRSSAKLLLPKTRRGELNVEAAGAIAKDLKSVTSYRARQWEDIMAPKAPNVAISEEIAERTQAWMGDYFGWLQNAFSASPWTNMELNKKLMSYASETVSSYVAHTQQLSQAKDFQDAAMIQIEFVKTRMELFNQRARELGEIYAKMTAATATTFGVST
jgi:hypothetical protein